MMKSQELSDPTSCWNKASIFELVFPLLERDICTPATIRFWATARVERGKNQVNDKQIQDALALATRIEDIQAKKSKSNEQPIKNYGDSADRFSQEAIHTAIGQLDNIISKLLLISKLDLVEENKQTLKHHAKDMIAAGQKILRNMDLEVDVDVPKWIIAFDKTITPASYSVFEHGRLMCRCPTHEDAHRIVRHMESHNG